VNREDVNISNSKKCIKAQTPQNISLKEELCRQIILDVKKDLG